MKQVKVLGMGCANCKNTVQLIQQVVDAGLSDLAHDAWSNHLADLQTAMSEEQFERYQHRSAA